MSKLVSLAKNFDIAVLVTHHTNKPGPGQPDLVDINRVRGSGAIAALFRMIWSLEQPDSKDETVRLKVVKSNLTSFPKPLGLVISDEGVEWTGAPENEDELIEGYERATKKKVAEQWLRQFLKDGPRLADEVKEEAEKAGHTLATLRRASETPNFINKFQSETNGRRCWMWGLADDQPS